MRRTAYLGLPLLLLLALAMQAIGQTPAAGPQFKNKAEYDSYNAAFTEKAPAKRAELAEKFMTDFKDSDISFRTNAYVMIVKGYTEAQNYPKAIDAALKATEALPSLATDKKNLAVIYSYGMNAAQQSNNVPKALELGDKVLSVVPDDLNTLITLATTIPASLPTDPAAKTAALDKSDDFANRAIGLVEKMDAKSVGMTDAAWDAQKNAIEGTLHTTLGGNAYTRANYAKAVDELLVGTKATPKEGLAWYQLGLVYMQQGTALTQQYLDSVKAQNDTIAATPTDSDKINGLKDATAKLETALRAKRDSAIDALATAVALGGVYQAPAKTQLEKLYTQKNGSLDGLDQLIASKKQP